MRYKRIIYVLLNISIISTVAMLTRFPVKYSQCAANQTVSSNVGFFYFKDYRKLEIDEPHLIYVRTAIEWNHFEPKKDGGFITDYRNKQAQIISDLLGSGFKIIPSIRARSGWAVIEGMQKCSSSPTDLDVRKPLKEGEIYSMIYYDFVKRVVERYHGNFEIVVIENEMNDNVDQWHSSVDAYLRLFLTAKKAFRDVDPGVKIADGGIQGYTLNWMVITDYLNRGDMAGALDFYRRFSGQAISEKKLRKQVKKIISTEPFIRAVKLYESDLFKWADVVNFHYYQRAGALPEVVNYIKRKVPADKPIMTNEIGIKKEFAGNADEAARDMVQKVAYLLSVDVKPIIWFSVVGKEGNNAGAFIDSKGNVISDTTNAFKAIAKIKR